MKNIDRSYTASPARRQRSGSLAVLAVPTLALLIAGAVPAAAALTWDNAGTASNNWSTASGNTNWQPGLVVWTNGEDAIFGATPEAGITTTTRGRVSTFP